MSSPVSTTCEPEFPALDVTVPLPIRADAWDCVAVDGVIATEAIEAGVGTLPRAFKPPVRGNHQIINLHITT